MTPPRGPHGLALAGLALLWSLFTGTLTVASGDYRIWIVQTLVGALATLALVGRAWRELRASGRIVGSLLALGALAILADAGLRRAPVEFGLLNPPSARGSDSRRPPG